MVVALGWILTVLDLPVRLRDARLESDDRIGLGICIRDSGKRQHARHVRAICRAQLRHLRRRVNIVAAIGQLDPTLQERGDVTRGMIEVLRHPEPEQVVGVHRAEVDRVDVGAEMRADVARESNAVADCSDAVEQLA